MENAALKVLDDKNLEFAEALRSLNVKFFWLVL
jgi:hypothetical protein